MEQQVGPVTDAELDQFTADQQARYDAYYEANGFSFGRATHSYTKGQRYARIIRHDPHGSHGSLVCFVDLTNGDIHKGSWKAPVKNGKRGNIRTADRGASCMTQFGTAYLR